MSRGVGSIQQKVLLLLLGGLALGLSRSPGRYFRILRLMGKEWRYMRRAALWRAVGALYKSKLVQAKLNADGTYTLLLTEKGKQRALTFKLDEMEIKKPSRWDGKWRMVLFDIPEKRKKVREALRMRLRRLGFLEFQKSVFVYPYPCDDEIDFVIEFYAVRAHVRKVVTESMDNELHFRLKFGLQKN